MNPQKVSIGVLAFLFVLNPYRNRVLDGEYLRLIPFFICGISLALPQSARDND
ncbi:TPA: hypothetical protein ACHVFJ_000174 [Streptococcus suis]